MEEDLVTYTLVENLLLLYPDGPPFDENQIRKWLRELVGQSTASPDKGDKNCEATEEKLKMAVTRAVQEWKRRSKEGKSKSNLPSTKKQQKHSFSLFAQLDAASWGAPRITVDDIQAASTPEEQILVLQKVAHVDDIVLDWNHISPLLQEGLGTIDLAEEYIELHRNWFDHGRASTEHWVIRCDLCQNVLQAIVQTIITGGWESESKLLGSGKSHLSAFHQAFFNLWTLWNDMWFDLMQNPVGQDGSRGSLERMGVLVLRLLKNLGTKHSGQQISAFQVHPAHFLALVDPSARWFKVWATHLTPPHLFQMLHTADLLPTIWQRISSHSCVLPSRCSSLPEMLEAVLYQHSLCFMGTILTCMRLKCFPTSLIWGLDGVSLKAVTLLSLEALKGVGQDSFPAGFQWADIEDENNDCFDLSTASSARALSDNQMLELFQFFLKAGKDSNLDTGEDAQNLGTVCAEAVEVLLMGTLSETCYKSGFHSIFTLCQKYVAQSNSLGVCSSFDFFLSRIVQRASP